MEPTAGYKAKAVKDTWGKHCNRVFFFHRSYNDTKVPVIKMPSGSAFGVLCDSLRHVLETDESFDWILVTTEDTFALPENLRYYVAPFNASQPFYLGHAMTFWNIVYNWGDAGYALSRGAVDRLVARYATSVYLSLHFRSYVYLFPAEDYTFYCKSIVFG